MLVALLGLMALIVSAPVYVLGGIAVGANWFVNRTIAGRRMRTNADAELNQEQAELRGTILQLGDALGMEAHEARKALIRESCRASGCAPKRFG